MRRRTGAFIIDMILVLIVTSTLGVILPDFSMGPLINKTTAVFFSVMGVYFIAFHSMYGQTLGKRLFKLRVARNGQSPIPVEVSIYRYLVKATSMILLFIGLLMAFSDKDRRGLHDKLAETVVLEV